MSTTIQRHALGLTWTETDAMARSAHALQSGGQVWLVDPYDDATALSAATELGSAAGVIQLLDRHNRDCQTIAQRLEVPYLRLPAAISSSPFSVVDVVSRRWWRERALWWEREQTLIVAEAVGTAPAFALGRPVGVHPLLRLVPPRRALSAHRPDRLLVGHGPVLESGAGPALDQALASARSDLPALILKLPSLVRGG